LICLAAAASRRFLHFTANRREAAAAGWITGQNIRVNGGTI
jgi:hypothetical protein